MNKKSDAIEWSLRRIIYIRGSKGGRFKKAYL